MLAAAVEAVEDVGYARMTVAQVIGRARVSRKTFYDVFADREDCFLAAFDHAIDQARAQAKESYDRESDWRNGIRSALARLLVLMDEEPDLARLCVVEALGAGHRILEHRARALAEVAEVIDRGREARAASGEPPEVTAECVAGAIFAVLHARLLEGDGEPLTNLLGPLMSMIVLPYLGPKAASKELDRPPLEATVEGRAPSTQSKRDPLEGLNIRLTYRTVRVLMVIAEYPGASNRKIAEGSGIADQGQISKLLARLARLDLIENVGEGHERGASNEWHLTPRGRQVERATRPL
jgi:AcrR family transcriptional regulator/DNA-binding MarR family transcriptional regulator